MSTEWEPGWPIARWVEKNRQEGFHTLTDFGEKTVPAATKYIADPSRLRKAAEVVLAESKELESDRRSYRNISAYGPKTLKLIFTKYVEDLEKEGDGRAGYFAFRLQAFKKFLASMPD